jgi:hypothetical protein
MFLGNEVSTSVIVLSVLAVWGGLLLLGGVTVFAVRRTGSREIAGFLWGSGLGLAGAVLAFLPLKASPRDLDAERRVIETRAFELTARAIAPGSALTCLDAVASDPVEAACEKNLFDTPEAVAAAIAYVDAKYSLLAASVVVAERDPSYRSTVERLRRGIEADRFGVVAHVLSTRGCKGPDCADLSILRDSKRILANMNGQTFASHVNLHSLGWSPSGAPLRVTAPSAPAVSSASREMAPMQPDATEVAPTPSAMPPTIAGSGRKRPDYPSAASIPAISIMDAEVTAAPVAEPKAAPQRRQLPRTSAARDQSPAIAPRPAPVSAQGQSAKTVVPQSESQTSGSR